MSVTSDILADNLNVSVLINGQPVYITSLEYKAKADNARQVTFSVYGQECTF